MWNQPSPPSWRTSYVQPSLAERLDEFDDVVPGLIEGDVDLLGIRYWAVISPRVRSSIP